jgi:hypothetical protein
MTAWTAGVSGAMPGDINLSTAFPGNPSEAK